MLGCGFESLKTKMLLSNSTLESGQMAQRRCVLAKLAAIAPRSLGSGPLRSFFYLFAVASRPSGPLSQRCHLLSGHLRCATDVDANP